jgi:hypothetical protein
MPAKSRKLSAVHKANLPAPNPPTLSEISNLCSKVSLRISNHRSVHEMVHTIACLCEEGDRERWQVAAMWPGIAFIMDYLSADCDELLSALKHVNDKALDAHAAEKGGAK